MFWVKYDDVGDPLVPRLYRRACWLARYVSVLV